MAGIAPFVLVALAYFAGSELGLVLRFPPATTSVLWPPNAILTATLLLTARRRWWMYLLAAFPAHVAAQVGTSWPTPLVLALFATNCSEALLAAAGVRAFSDGPARFDTLRRVVVFVTAAGLVAPFVSSFADAAVVTAFRSEAYWVVWRTRLFSNVLTELTVVPMIVMTVSSLRGPWRRVAPRSYAEAGLLLAALLAVGLLAFDPSIGEAVLAEFHSPLVLLLPFLLWSAVRFGPRGLSLCLLTTTLLAIGVGMTRYAMFTPPEAASQVRGLQVFLSIAAVPLMCLAGVLEERRRANAALAERLAFEELLSRLSTAFLHLPSDEVERAVGQWLGRLGEYLGVDCAALAELAETGDAMSVRCWAASGVAPEPRIVSSREFPWAIEQLRRETSIAFGDPDELPAAAAPERRIFQERSIRAGLVLPLEAGGRVFGGLALLSLSGRAWPEEFVARLRLVAAVFANALARRESDDALRTSEGMKSAILASLSSGVAVLDRAGTIVAVNEMWIRQVASGIGVSFLGVWERAAADPAAVHAQEARAGIEAVLGRRRSTFAIEYRERDGGVERWFAMSVVPLDRLKGGAVVSHTEVTEWKRAEIDAQRSRQELAHFTRVSTMGALAASLAHELNQPLAGILSNAQAARRFLDTTPPDLTEVGSILSDIVDDDRRAGQVIARLRELLRKGETRYVPVDVNAVVGEVARLLASDALIRNVRIHLELAPRLPTVPGDHVQLQQVVLNLLLNGMDAMAECPENERVVIVRTESHEGPAIHVAVEDAGTGLDVGKHTLMFEPFYTTKPTGMGMGLSISRSIIEAHGGLLWATDNPIRGATFSFALKVGGGDGPA